MFKDDFEVVCFLNSDHLLVDILKVLFGLPYEEENLCNFLLTLIKRMDGLMGNGK